MMSPAALRNSAGLAIEASSPRWADVVDEATSVDEPSITSPFSGSVCACTPSALKGRGRWASKRDECSRSLETQRFSQNVTSSLSVPLAEPTSVLHGRSILGEIFPNLDRSQSQHGAAALAPEQALPLGCNDDGHTGPSSELLERLKRVATPSRRGASACLFGARHGVSPAGPSYRERLRAQGEFMLQCSAGLPSATPNCEAISLLQQPSNIVHTQTGASPALCNQVVPPVKMRLLDLLRSASECQDASTAASSTCSSPGASSPMQHFCSLLGKEAPFARLSCEEVAFQLVAAEPDCYED